MNYRRLTISTALIMTALMACAGPEPVPEPGMEVLQHARNEEMQVTRGVDWSGYDKIILHSAEVDFRENWKQDQERIQNTTIRDQDMERFETTMSDQLNKVLIRQLSATSDYELTTETGPGIMRFIPRIVDLDIRGPGRIRSAIVESMVNSKGSLTIELVIRDSVTDEILGVAWQHQSDPQEGHMEMTTTVNNTVAFRLMMQRWASWQFDQLDKARNG